MLAMKISQQQNLRGELTQNEPMAKHTSWRVGGMAEFYYKPFDLNDLSMFLEQQDSAITFVGLGSNLLVRDSGVNGVVVCTSGTLNNISELDNSCWNIEVGVPSPKVARSTAKKSLTGAEFLCGIPGTFGGALAMNAGALGGEIWNIVNDVTMIDKDGKTRIRAKNDFDIAYRSVKLKAEINSIIGVDEWFISATIQLKNGCREESEKLIKAHLARRSATQPTQLPNAGSVFRNPLNDYAARLIESVGLKGYCIGGACVSEKHANFIINTGTATANDIETLIEYVHDSVKKEFKLDLIREVRIIGERT